MGDQCSDHPNPRLVAIPDQDPQDAQNLVDVKTNHVTLNQEQKDNFLRNMIQASQTLMNMVFKEQQTIKLLLKTYLAT